jgi:hypothetical protein
MKIKYIREKHGTPLVNGKMPIIEGLLKDLEKYGDGLAVMNELVYKAPLDALPTEYSVVRSMGLKIPRTRNVVATLRSKMYGLKSTERKDKGYIKLLSDLQTEELTRGFKLGTLDLVSLHTEEAWLRKDKPIFNIHDINLIKPFMQKTIHTDKKWLSIRLYRQSATEEWVLAGY